MLKINTVTMKKQIEEILKKCYTDFGYFDESKVTKELLDLFSVSESKLPTEQEARQELDRQDASAGYPESSEYSDGYDKGFVDCVRWIRDAYSR